MSDATIPAKDHPDFDESGHRRTLSGLQNSIVAGLALTFSAYQLWIATFSPLSSIVIRSLHVGFLLLLTFCLFPGHRRASRITIAWYDCLLAGAGFSLSLYQWVFEAELVQRSGDPTVVDLVVGGIVVVLVFEAARRIVGLALPVICAAFLAYGLFGQYLPEAVATRGYGLDQIIGQLYLGTEGILGIPTMVSATYIFLFILFGSFLEHAGMINLFNDLALGTVGHFRGGPAKVAVISSGTMGMISGSGVANVLTVGAFTIPLMKKFGYSSEFAGGVEATASMGGQIMPPVMGAVAFIMAETLGVPYLDVVKAAIIPALLYFASAFWMVHLEAGRSMMKGIPKAECPNPWQAMRRNWYLLIPLFILVTLLFSGYTPMFSGLAGLAMTAILILGVSLGREATKKTLRYGIWIIIGLAASAFRKFGVGPIVGLICALVVFNLLSTGGRETIRLMGNSLIDGAKQALGVGMACALVGVIIGVVTLTGVASNFTSVIVELGTTSIFLSLILTMVACLILGMGIPTIPNYIITSSIAAPALLMLGVPLIVSHMFVFYFGIMADLTPPVALAAFAAASIAKTSGLKIGVQAMRVAFAGFVIPFMAVYDPVLMLQGTYTLWDLIYILIKVLASIGLWGVASIGFLDRPVTWPERCLAALGALFLVAAIPWTDAVGFALGAFFIVVHLRLYRKLLPGTAP